MLLLLIAAIGLAVWGGFFDFYPFHLKARLGELAKQQHLVTSLAFLIIGIVLVKRKRTGKCATAFSLNTRQVGILLCILGGVLVVIEIALMFLR